MPTKKKCAAPPLPRLRSEAEAALARTVPPVPPPAPARPTAELVHELQVHQIELEMQNEALRQAQLALEESRDRYVDLYEFAPVAYLSLSGEGLIEAINLTGASLLGEARGKLLHRRFDRFVAADERDQWCRFFLQAEQHDGKQSCELSLCRRDGTVIDVGLECLRIASAGALPELRITLSEITVRKAAEMALRDANRRLESLAAGQAAHLRQLAGELSRAEERERERLYELLHDEVQPLLVAARLSLSGVSERTPAGDCVRIAAEACEHIGQVITVARTLSLQLSPPLIREHGLYPALESLCRWAKGNYGLEVDLGGAPDAEPDEVAMRLLCFSAVRELLMNVVKHAGPTRVKLTLQLVDADTLFITVADQGRGFDSTAVTTGSGLAGIERRLGMFGGALQVASRPGQGTVVSLSIPLRPAWESKFLPDEFDRLGERGSSAQNIDRR